LRTNMPGLAREGNGPRKGVGPSLDDYVFSRLYLKVVFEDGSRELGTSFGRDGIGQYTGFPTFG